ncbi:bile acid:sodium symporter family protein [Massilia sp. G4R7]|uniref:Bile acid:sodium symporter family protein n=1 Tax=Massilia phyllostachyos TaxID=2898585 RepID=A0ABS8Q8L6_9BURK|nr:bile acid:sodium symporter family protein [Massilia phyllostachyos]MCD2518102.1 bile acid:sodium symporter family protein [Massilia phyllostachyos]
MNDFITLLPTLLIAALALIMFGLGLSLTLGDFRRLLGHPKAVVLALVLQALVLPAICYGLIVLLGVAPVYAVGLMLLAASPGGVSANLFSHLFGGNVAMNISLTAINTVLSIVSLPLIANFAIDTFAKSGQVVPMQTAKVVEVIVIVLIPVAIGMVVKRRAPSFAARMDTPMKRFSMAVLGALAVVAIAKEWDAITASFASIGLAVILFNVASLGLGYYVPRLLGMVRANAIAIGYEIGIHNSTLAIFVALSVLDDFQLMLPAAIYSVTMYVFATAFGFVVLGRKPATAAPAPVA